MAKVLTGKVLSLKMQNTAVVEVERAYRHRLYHKTIRRHKKYKVGMSGVKVNEGDIVRIIETRPISKDKHFVIKEVIEKA